MGNCCQARQQETLIKSQSHSNDFELSINAQYPTYEDIIYLYMVNELPPPPHSLELHQKEHMLFMIINLLRQNPKIFNRQLNGLRGGNYKRKSSFSKYMISNNDYADAIDLISQIQPAHPLEYRSSLLSSMKQQQEQINLDQKIFEPIKPSKQKKMSSSSLDTRDTYDIIFDDHSFLHACHDSGIQKEINIDYKCWEQLTITSIKEFWEAFIHSMKNNSAFHTEIFSNKYQEIQIKMQFEKNSQFAKLQILLYK